MSKTLSIRDGKPGDSAAIEALYPLAFPDEDLLPVVGDLLGDPSVARSLIATIEAQVIGHIVFTDCDVAGCSTRIAMLGPLAVAPEHQRQGVGTALIRDGLRRMQETGVGLVVVLGDPAYYGRHGFVTEKHVAAPYRLPKEWNDAWQSRYLGDTTERCSGTLSVPAAWDKRELWAP